MSIKRTAKANARHARLSGKVCLTSAVALALASTGMAVQAASIDIGNSDFRVRWDNQVRYNAGWRMEKENKAFTNHANHDDTEHKFGRGDMVINRLDLLSEFDVVYKNAHGFRVSGAAWYDNAYQGSAKPRVDATGNYVNNHYNSYAERYMAGLSGEFLDAFVFTTLNFGDMTANIKAGQHNVYWGESLYSIGNSIAYSQGPVDTIKSATSPGSEAKELFLPLKQISGTLQLTNELALSAQYLLDWKPFRLVPGGTYFAGSDGARSDFGAPGVPNGKDLEPGKKRGDFGVNLRWSPWWLGGTAGVYYRKFDEKLPWSFLDLSSGAPAVRLAYARDTELYGLSLTKNIGTVSVAGELSYRKNTGLNSTTAMFADASYNSVEGARGDTWHALVNAIYLLPRTALWEGGTLQGEVTYTKLDKVTENGGRFNSRGYGCTSTYKDCADDHALGMQVGFTPEWPQLFAGWDVSMPMTFAWGIDGNSPTPGGTTEDVYSYSIGVQGKYRNNHTFAVKWVDSHADYKKDANGVVAYQNGSAIQNDHGWLSFSYKTSF